MNKHIYPDRVRCLADKADLIPFVIDGDTYHAADRKEAEQMHKDGVKSSEPEPTPDLFES